MINILYLHAGAEMYGADKVLLELVKGLDKAEFTPIVVLPCNGLLVEALKKEGIETEIIPYPILRRKYYNLKGILQYIVQYIGFSKKVCEFAQQKNIQLLHINTTAVLEGIYLKKKLKIPLIWHIHEIIIKPKIVFKVLSSIVGKYADKIVVVSNAVGQHWIGSKRMESSKIKTIYNGVNNAVFNPNNNADYLRTELHIPPHAQVVGMIGRVNACKGQLDFLKAIEPLLAKYMNMFAVMVGGVFQGEEWRLIELEKIVSSSPYKDRIFILNFREDTANLHALFDVFVLPSTSPDSLPTVVLEAMATGKPIVGYRHGGLCEMLIDGEVGLLANVCCPTDLSRKINLIIHDKELCSAMGMNAIKRQRECFSMQSFLENFSDLYKVLNLAKVEGFYNASNRKIVKPNI